MAMPPSRSSKRRAGPPRWLLVPFALTILALLVDAAVHARSPKVAATLSSSAWVDKVLPDIIASTAQGREIAQVASEQLHAGADGASHELNSAAADAASTYRSVAAGDPPGQVQAAAGLLDACLVARKEGSAEMAIAVQRLLKGASTASVVAEMSSAVTEFEVSDSAYQLFVQQMGHMASLMPASQWVSAGSYQTAKLLAFVHRLQTGLPKAPATGLAIDAVSTTPPPLSLQGSVEVLSPASSFSVTVVVADTGQSPLQGVNVTARATPAAGASSQQVSATVDLSPGQATAVTLPGLRTPASTPATVVVEVTMPGATSPSASKQLQVELPGANFATATTGASSSTTSTTTAPGATTTAASGATTSAASGATTSTASGATTTAASGASGLAGAGGTTTSVAGSTALVGGSTTTTAVATAPAAGGSTTTGTAVAATTTSTT
jgi:DNA-binding NarL/FixJ family response regulator